MKKGFTLIELLVVIAIVGIISAVLVAAINNSQGPNSSIEDFKSTDTGVVFPEPTDYYVDSANLFTPEQKTALSKKLDDISNAGKIQIGVLVTNSTAPLTIEQYSIRLAEKWKVGFRGKSNGAIIIIATDDRTVRIETGHGLTGQITDSEAKAIIEDDMVPLLKKGEWYNAVDVAINRLNSLAQ